MEGVQECDAEFEFVFGFGSIMNTTTHAAWLPDDSHPRSLPGRIVRLNREFGYERRWNFRSTTGFTALGISRSNGSTQKQNMNGVLFKVPSSMIPGFDRREVGYDKVRVPFNFIELCDGDYRSSATTMNEQQQYAFDLKEGDKIWIYVPKASQNREADESHPLLQSYVDTVLQGCLEWGGEAMGIDFVLSTGSWSPYFLNDVQSSRRPWLFRKDYDIIDAILQKHSDLTHYADRRHPEEFASTFLIRRMRGTWSIPRRNRNFTGRDMELGQLHAKLTQQHDAYGSNNYCDMEGSINFLFLHGMGGVGKSSICTEYCYRHFPSTYGLVIWLNAESAETLVADYRQLLADLADGLDVTSNNSVGSTGSKDSTSTDEVIGEVKTRLFRCQVPWLLVFDNLEDIRLLEKFVPRGASSGSRGHCLVTSRVVELQSCNGTSSLVLGCLSPSESVEMLRRALVGSESSALLADGSKDEKAAIEICEKLGHLPLALGMAAAYMQRCDVSCIEYVDRYVRFEETGRSLLRHQAGRLHDYSLTVSASLALSLKAMAKESNTASEVVRLLCWLGPDHITKALLRALLAEKNKAEEERLLQAMHPTSFPPAYGKLGGTIFLLSGLVLLTASLLPSKLSHVGSRLRMGVGLWAILSLSAAGANALVSTRVEPSTHQAKARPLLVRQVSSRSGLDEFEQGDVVWNILKSFSILTVKEGKGSMHRLLAEALRSAQDEEEICWHLKICVDSMPRIWKFNPRRADTWRDSFHVVEHLKSVVARVADNYQSVSPGITLKAGILSKEAGVFSAMAVNGFKEAQASLELALNIFEWHPVEKQAHLHDQTLKAQGDALHELGRVLRYQGNFSASEETLLSALSIRNSLARTDPSARLCVADTFHELGVLEVKKYSLDNAQTYLTQALDLRRALEEESGDIDGDCAATLHQLAAVHVVRKPPSLEQAERLLQDALKLSRQIGQRAATLKQLARVTIRQGHLDTGEDYLRRALELYIELYGERTMHINVAGVKFQQGALAFQRELFESAWIHFSECLRIRRHVYAYARPIDSTKEDPLHLEVSCVVHELGCVAFAQGRVSQALTLLQTERSILQKLEDSSCQTERLRQAMLTNITWLRKCAKEMGDEAAVVAYTSQRALMKHNAKRINKKAGVAAHSGSEALQCEAMACRLHARKFALAKNGAGLEDRKHVLLQLARLSKEIDKAPCGSVKIAAQLFYDDLTNYLNSSHEEVPKEGVLKACDSLRDSLRAHGAQVSD